MTRHPGTTTFYVLAAAILVLALSVGCGDDRLPRPSAKTPVILISIDTLRSDRLPAYGYKGVDTPAIDALRADGILFEKTYAHCPLTLPSHANILTGRLPADNGLRDNLGYTMDPTVATLAQTLKQNGYATGASVSSYVLRGETGINRGFDFYEDDILVPPDVANLGGLQRSGHETTRIATDWISKRQGQPFFFLLHLYEPHTPYDPPEPHRRRYGSPYDGEIAAADEIVGKFVQFLKEADIYDKALLVLLSDHGEGLGEHGEDEHGIFLYRDTIQVPLIVKLPDSRLKGRSVSSPVQLIDLFPTIAEQTKSTFDRSTIQGKSLLSFLSELTPPPRQIFSESYYARFHFGWSELHSIVEGPYHFIRAPRPELYELASDPQEKNNVLAKNRRVYAAMNRALQPLIREPAAPAAVDPEEARKLAALGYLGSTVAVAPGAVLRDPKDEVETVKQIKLALGYFSQERDLEALKLFEKLLSENPGMLDIWDAAARSYARLHRYEEAIDAAKNALRLSPRTTHLLLLIATASLELKRFDEAQQHAELALKDQPGQAHEVLARIWLARKDYDRAKREAELALQTKRDRVPALLTLARIENEKDNGRAALSYCDQVIAIMKEKGIEKVHRLHFNRGDALARLGRHGEAEAEFREEIRLFPTDPQSYMNLILLYVTQDRLDEGTQVIFDLEKAAPTPPSYEAIAETLRVVGDPQGSRYWARRGLQRFPAHRRLRALASG